MTQPEQSTRVNEDKEVTKNIELRDYDDEVTPNDSMVKEEDKNELRRRREQEIVQKANAFWNHPALRDVSSIEKLSYLQKEQGLTNTQIHKVWEGINRVDDRFNKSLYYNTTGESNVTAPEPYSGLRRRHNHHHRYKYRQHSFDSPTSTTDGQDFNSNEAPYTQHLSSNYNHLLRDQQQLHPAQLRDNRFAMKQGDESISVVRGLSLLGVGGFLGVAGAAAMRWINGGRFDLLPPPTTYRMNSLNNTSTSSIENTSNKRQLQGQASTLSQHIDQRVREQVDERTECNIDHENNLKCDEDEYDDGEYSEINQVFGMEGCLMQRIDALLSSIDSNSALQERLFLKLANASTITDDSMSLLKQTIGSERNNNKQLNTSGSSGNNTFLLTQLKEVKGDLESLCETIMNKFSSNSGVVNANEGWREECSELLHKFETCIAIVENPNNQLSVESADSKPISTSETTATENQARQDAKSSTFTPSTPATDISDKNQLQSPFLPPTLILLSLRDCIIKIAEKNDVASLRSGSQLLYLYLTNLSGNPDNRRYRKIYTSNESFQKVKSLIGGEDLLRSVGFVEEFDEEIFEWVPTRSTEKETSALILVKEAATALCILKKPDNTPSSELVQMALASLSSSSALCFPNQSSLPSELLGKKENGDGGDNIPHTPSGSALLSPPMPKKMPFIPTPSDVSVINSS